MNHVIMLNGTSSAGKTTLARAIQAIAEGPYLLTGFDACMALVPPVWSAFHDGSRAAEGVRFETGFDDEDHPTLRVGLGDVGSRIVRAFQRSVAALPSVGDPVIVDEMIVGPDVLAGWLRALAGLRVYLVGVHCPVEILDQREAARASRPIGLARGQLATVHKHGRYDLEVDTSRPDTADELARRVLHHCATSEPRAFPLLSM